MHDKNPAKATFDQVLTSYTSPRFLADLEYALAGLDLLQIGHIFRHYHLDRFAGGPTRPVHIPDRPENVGTYNWSILGQKWPWRDFCRAYSDLGAVLLLGLPRGRFPYRSPGAVGVNY